MNSNSGNVLAAFLGGVIVGGVAALLLAPKSGAEMRADLERYAREKYAEFESSLDEDKEDPKEEEAE